MYLHGGISGDKFFNDTFELDLNDSKWTKLRCSSPLPTGRAGHSGIVIEPGCFVIFGGLTLKGACNDLWLFNTGTPSKDKNNFEPNNQFSKYSIVVLISASLTWTAVVCEGCIPLPRLAFGVCDIPLLNWEDHEKGSTSQAGVGL